MVKRGAGEAGATVYTAGQDEDRIIQAEECQQKGLKVLAAQYDQDL